MPSHSKPTTTNRSLFDRHLFAELAEQFPKRGYSPTIVLKNDLGYITFSRVFEDRRMFRDINGKNQEYFIHHAEIGLMVREGKRKGLVETYDFTFKTILDFSAGNRPIAFDFCCDSRVNINRIYRMIGKFTKPDALHFD